MRKVPAILVALVAVAALGVACSSGGSSEDATTITATLDEYTVGTSADSAPAGPVSFDVSNVGVEGHNLLVVRTDAAADGLPVEGSTASEEGTVAETDVLAQGERQTITVDLDPGAYVLICNVPEHYRAGMYAPFTVA